MIPVLALIFAVNCSHMATSMREEWSFLESFVTNGGYICEAWEYMQCLP
jgi:hypothetical protein